MNDIINSNSDLAIIRECFELSEKKESQLLESIFDYADEKVAQKGRRIVSLLCENAPAVASLSKGMKKDQKLRIILSDEAKAKIASGEWNFMKSRDSNGLFKAVLTDKKGEIQKIVNIKFEDVVTSVDPVEMAVAMQGAAMQNQLRAIADKLENISDCMEQIRAGQYNDRLALYYCGEVTYREALATKDNVLKKSLMLSSITALTDASSKMQLQLKDDVNRLCDNYDSSKRMFKKSEDAEKSIIAINATFEAVHKATALKAAIYYSNGEYGAVSVVLDGYEEFLTTTFTKENVQILRDADKNDKRINGLWKARQEELPKQIRKVQKTLNNPELFAIEVSREEIE